MRPCIACPFRDGETLEATQAQNLGCLPSSNEMVKRFDERGESLSCHGNEDIACRGLSECRKTEGAKVIRHSAWYEGAAE